MSGNNDGNTGSSSTDDVDDQPQPDVAQNLSKLSLNIPSLKHIPINEISFDSGISSAGTSPASLASSNNNSPEKQSSTCQYCKDAPGACFSCGTRLLPAVVEQILETDDDSDSFHSTSQDPPISPNYLLELESEETETSVKSADADATNPCIIPIIGGDNVVDNPGRHGHRPVAYDNPGRHGHRPVAYDNPGRHGHRPVAYVEPQLSVIDDGGHHQPNQLNVRFPEAETQDHTFQEFVDQQVQDRVYELRSGTAATRGMALVGEELPSVSTKARSSGERSREVEESLLQDQEKARLLLEMIEASNLGRFFTFHPGCVEINIKPTSIENVENLLRLVYSGEWCKTINKIFVDDKIEKLSPGVRFNVEVNLDELLQVVFKVNPDFVLQELKSVSEKSLPDLVCHVKVAYCHEQEHWFWTPYKEEPIKEWMPTSEHSIDIGPLKGKILRPDLLMEIMLLDDIPAPPKNKARCLVCGHKDDD